MKKLLSALALAAASLSVSAAPMCGTAYAASGCCKTCKAGKACGDS
ncbi:hypothetical protein [Altererythrobacter sp. MTPC7]